MRDRLQALGLGTIVADSGILAGPLDIVPDVTRAEVARLGGQAIEALRQAGSRGEAVHGMLLGLQRLALNLYRDGRLDGVLCLGGAEGAVLGASAIDREGAVQEFDPLEVDLVRSILPHARQVILVAHDEKFDRRAPHLVTQLRDVDVLITNGDPSGRFNDPDLLKSLRVIALP